MKVKQIAEKIKHYESNKQLTRQQLLEKNLQRFREMVAWLKENSPFYAEIIKKEKIAPEKARPEDFPVLTKEILTNNFDRIVTNPELRRDKLVEYIKSSEKPGSLFLDKYWVIHSSGTSGKKSTFVFENEEFLLASTQSYRFYKGKKKRTAYIGLTGGLHSGASLVQLSGRHVSGLFSQTKLLDCLEPVDKICEELNAFQPDLLVCYGSMMPVIADSKERGLLQIEPDDLQSISEALSRHTAEKLQNIFPKTNLINCYACSEVNYLGFARTGMQDMQLLEDDLIFEINDLNLNVTSLYQRSMPLIRYQIRDKVIPVPHDPQIHGPFQHIEQVVGREEMALWFKCTEKHWEVFFPGWISEKCLPGVHRIQAHVQGEDHLCMWIEAVEDSTPEQKEKIKQEAYEAYRKDLDRKHLQNVQLTTRIVDHIPNDPKTGKFKSIVREKPDR